MSETVIYARDLLAAAAALQLTNSEAAARLGLKLETFDSIVEREKNGRRLSISSKHPRAFAAAMALLEEARRVENEDDDVAAGGAAPRPKGKTRERSSKGRRERPKGSSSHPGARGGNGFDAFNGSGPDADHRDDEEHHVGSDSDHVGVGDADHAGADDAGAHAGADAAGAGDADHASTDHAGADGGDQADHADGEQTDADAPDYYNLDAAELIKQAAALAGPPDHLEKHARAIIKAAACADMDDVEDSQLVEALAKSWKTGRRGIRGVLKAERAAYLASQRPTAEEQAAKAASEAQAAADVRQQREAALWASVSQLALDPQLLDRLLLYAVEAGVVAEESAIIAILLVSTSRLLVGRALCLLRRGAPASGKNYATDVVLKLMPPEALIHLNSGSAKALQYYGGEDEDALVCKVLYVPEAAGLARRGGDEPEIVTMLRSLISEGEINYLTVVTREEGQSPITVNMKKKGPTALIMTSARDDVEEEMLTRLMMADSDETPATTNRVDSDLHKRAAGHRPPALSSTTTVMWQDLQHWLELGGPYDVVIPFAEALRAAYASVPVPLRIRRDAGNILGAIKAAAVVHRAQRQLDSDERIIAELADYEAAYRAFAPGLAALYRPRVSPGVIALVEALERIKAAAEQARMNQFAADNPGAPQPHVLQPLDSVQATYRQLGKQLGINSTDTVGSRVKAALAEEVIEIVDAGIYGRGAPRRYRIKIGSAVLGSQASGSAVLPTPASVQAMIDDPQAAADAVANFDAEVKATNDTADAEADAALFREMFGEPT